MLRNVEVNIAALLTSIPKVQSSIYCISGLERAQIGFSKKFKSLLLTHTELAMAIFLQSVTEYRCQV
jgi:hypothetical protein